MKLFALLCACILFLGCTVKSAPIILRDSKPAVKVEKDTFADEGYTWQDQTIDGMKYRIYFKKYGDRSNTGENTAAIYVINLSKDKLEMKLLEKQLIAW